MNKIITIKKNPSTSLFDKFAMDHNNINILDFNRFRSLQIELCLTIKNMVNFQECCIKYS